MAWLEAGTWDVNLVDRKDHRAAKMKVGGLVAMMAFLMMVVWKAVTRVDTMEIHWAVKSGIALA